MLCSAGRLTLSDLQVLSWILDKVVAQLRQVHQACELGRAEGHKGPELLDTLHPALQRASQCLSMCCSGLVRTATSEAACKAPEHAGSRM